jgi:phosphoglycerate dehydrogenase-like enzyme
LGKVKVVLPWPAEKDLVEVIKDAEANVEALRKYADVDTSQIPSEEEWFSRCRDAYAASSPRIRLARYPEFLESAKELRMIQTFSIGYDHIDVTACTRRGVVVCNVAEVMAESVAQHTWALILAASKHVVRSDRVIREGGWRIEGRFGVELYGKTLGIIGLGDIGGRVALKGAMAFGMRVLAYDPYVLPARAQLYCASLVDLPTLLREADVVSVHCPLTAETRHIIGREQLKLMKPTAILVNTARGQVIDEAALVEALEGRRIMAAALDVFEQEPLDPASPLRKLNNVVLTGHIASSTREAFSKTWQGGIDNILRFVKGERPHWVINPAALSVKR